MDHTVSVVKLMDKQCVLVHQVIQVHHQHVDQNVLSILSVIEIKRVPIRSVEILALEHAELVQNAKSLIIILFVVVRQDSVEIRSLDVFQSVSDEDFCANNPFKLND